MLTRAILLALCLGFGAPAWAQDAAPADCLTPEEIVAHVVKQIPLAKFVVYKDADSERIQEGILRTVGRALTGKRDFMVFSRPDREVLLIVGVKDGCYEGHSEVRREVLDKWLAGVSG